jgi:hypothetical protein
LVGGTGGASQGFFEAGGVVVENLMAADLQGGAVGDESDHGVG